MKLSAKKNTKLRKRYKYRARKPYFNNLTKKSGYFDHWCKNTHQNRLFYSFKAVIQCFSKRLVFEE